MSKLSFMKWYPLDWLRDTRVLSAEAKGLWIDILCMAWNEPERGCYSRSKMDFCRELQIPQKRYELILSEIAKVGTVTFRNDLVTVMSRRMSKLDKAYKLASERQARFRSNANITRHVTAKTLDIRRSQDVRLLKTTAGESPPLDVFVNTWQRREDRGQCAGEIAMGLKAYKLGFRMEEDLYKKIMGDKHERNENVRSKSIDQQALERRRTQEAERVRREGAGESGLVGPSSAGEILDGVRSMPDVQSEA